MKLNKSNEELDNEKKWDEFRKVAVIMIVMSSFVLLGTWLGHKDGYKKGVASVEPETVYVSADLQRFTEHCNEENCLYSYWYEGNKVTSVLAEKKKCDELGGEFEIKTTDQANYDRLGKSGGSFVPYKGYTITCTSPSKELFKINIK